MRRLIGILRVVLFGAMTCMSGNVVGTSVPVAAADNSGGATLTILVDPVEVAHAADGVFSVASDGQMLQAGDTIRTGSNGLALVTFFDGSETQLGPASSVQLEHAEASPTLHIAILQRSGVTTNRVVPLPPGGSFSTDTPTAAAMVRGTSYVVAVAASDAKHSVTSVVLLTDRDKHVGHIVVAPHAAIPPVHLDKPGEMAASSDASMAKVQASQPMLASLESSSSDLQAPTVATVSPAPTIAVAPPATP